MWHSEKTVWMKSPFKEIRVNVEDIEQMKKEGYVSGRLIKGKNHHFSRHELAWMTFYPEGNGKAKPGYVLHHKDPSLKHNDPARYAEWRIEDLEMLTIEEHISLHHRGFPLQAEAREKISTKNKGKTPWNLGIKQSHHVIDAIVKSRRKEIICIDDSKRFISIKDASEYYGIQGANIGAVANGKRKTAGGLKFKFV